MVRTQTIDRSHSDLNTFFWRCCHYFWGHDGVLELWLKILPFCWTQPANSWGVNCRKYHSFHTEDWIGRIKMCCAVTHQQGLEHIALMRWFTGSLYCIIYICFSFKPQWCNLKLAISPFIPALPLPSKAYKQVPSSWIRQLRFPTLAPGKDHQGQCRWWAGWNVAGWDYIQPPFFEGNHQNHIQFLDHRASGTNNQLSFPKKEKCNFFNFTTLYHNGLGYELPMAMDLQARYPLRQGRGS